MYVRQIAYDQLSMRQWLTTMIAIGLAVGALVAAVGGYSYYERSRNARNWSPATATVSGISELCHMSRKSGKRWTFVEAVECQNVDGYIAAHPDNKWKSSKVGYVTFEYSANGESMKRLAPHWRLSTQPVAAGQKLPIFFNPGNAAEFDRPIADEDVADVMVTAYIGLAIVAGLALFGALLGWMSERKRRDDARAQV